jgi:hypothetical protein
LFGTNFETPGPRGARINRVARPARRPAVFDERNSRLSKARRQEVFLALVEAQDQGSSLKDSRAEVARRFGVAIDGVRDIEREGLDAGWPPL